MEWIKRLFGKSKADIYARCDIEHMPAIGAYFPRYKGRYLWFNASNGLFVQTCDKSLICNCEYGKTIEEAQSWIDDFVEQQCTDNKIIKLTLPAPPSANEKSLTK